MHLKDMFAARRIGVLLLISVILASSGCGATTYGRAAVPSPDVPDQYTFKVYVAYGTGARESDELVEKEIREFMRDHGYDTFKVVAFSRETWPLVYFKYTVVFKPPKAP